jgi:hypothetical protein
MFVKTKMILLAIVAMFYLNTANAAWQWTEYMGMTGNYIHPLGQGSMERVLVLTMGKDFHACGWNRAAKVNSTIVGEQTFDALTSAFLSAWMANKEVSLLIEGCDGSSVRVYGIRIGK